MNCSIYILIDVVLFYIEKNAKEIMFINSIDRFLLSFSDIKAELPIEAFSDVSLFLEVPSDVVATLPHQSVLQGDALPLECSPM